MCEIVKLYRMPVSLQLLSQFPLLQPLPAEVKASLSARMTLHSFARRAMVMSKDKPAQELGFLVDGRLQGVDFTVDGRSVGLYFVDPGDYFGDLKTEYEKRNQDYIGGEAR